MKKTLIAAALMWIVLVGTTFGRNNNESSSDKAMIDRWHKASITKYSSWNDFMPNASITREQAAKMIVLWMWLHGDVQMPTSNSQCKFSDETTMDTSLKNWVYMSCKHGLFQGYRGNFMPHKNITKEEMMIVIQRLANQSPLIQEYMAKISLNLGSDGYLSRAELLRWLYALHLYLDAKGEESEVEKERAVIQDKLNNAKQLWASKNLTNYTLIQKVSCFCGPDYTRPIRYKVVNNSVDMNTAKYVDSSDTWLNNMHPDLHTIDQAFQIIQKALDDKADGIVVEYDSKYWYPASVSIDRSKMMADEEQYYTFTLVQ